MQAIETHYKGYRFRSRLEARWAVFFDQLGLSWEYEPEGFDLGDGVWYLPDFRVTLSDGDTVWLEVKPSNINSDPKFDEFSARLDAGKALMLSGDPWEVMGMTRPMKEPIRNLVTGDKHLRKLHLDGAIGGAAKIARQARFEHGERADG